MGNSMFSNFNNIDTTYQPNPFQPKYPTNCCTNNATPASPNKPYEILSADKSRVVGYFWYYGNSVDLIFDVVGEITSESTNKYIDASDTIAVTTLTATFYNFRYEPVFVFSTDPLIAKNGLLTVNGSTVTLSLTSELSAQLVKGIYYLDLVATHPTGYNETLFSSNQCDDLKFEVR